ncbi:MAG TPA: SDR family NAD(P)-dependent oxidoreductase, partial [Saprospiraceae bacterium]|nr:SDR family NAD(P)-dependent oxidoreductase [Saprospiraceae bacterium]
MTNKNIIVTGTSRGLGLDICRFLLEEGVCVFGISRTKSADTIALLAQYPKQYVHFDCDLADVSGIRNSVFTYINEHQIAVHGLVNNAALSLESLITDFFQTALLNLIYVNQIAPITL